MSFHFITEWTWVATHLAWHCLTVSAYIKLFAEGETSHLFSYYFVIYVIRLNRQVMWIMLVISSEPSVQSEHLAPGVFVDGNHCHRPSKVPWQWPSPGTAVSPRKTMSTASIQKNISKTDKIKQQQTKKIKFKKWVLGSLTKLNFNRSQWKNMARFQ